MAPLVGGGASASSRDAAESLVDPVFLSVSLRSAGEDPVAAVANLYKSGEDAAAGWEKEVAVLGVVEKAPLWEAMLRG